jgi:rhodanese-related sulfurtransferase
MPGYEQEGAQRGGHIPGAASVPWAQAVTEDGTFKSPTSSELYGARASSTATDIIAYCRIGERSAHTWFVLHELLGKQTSRTTTARGPSGATSSTSRREGLGLSGAQAARLARRREGPAGRPQGDAPSFGSLGGRDRGRRQREQVADDPRRGAPRSSSPGRRTWWCGKGCHADQAGRLPPARRARLRSSQLDDLRRPPRRPAPHVKPASMRPTNG